MRKPAVSENGNGQRGAEGGISVIICTRNRAALLGRALRSLAEQSLDPKQFEVVVVDDGSRDNTPGVCDAFHSELPNLICVRTDANMGIAIARNAGLKACTGEYILFTDDDCIADRYWVERMKAGLNREPIVAGCVASPFTNYIELCHNIAHFHAFMPGQKPGPKESIAGANMGFRRSAVEELKGFRRIAHRSDDMEIAFRARLKGYRPHFVPGAIVTHDPRRTSLATILSYAFVDGTSSVVLRNRYRRLLRTPLVLRSAPLLLLSAPAVALAATARIYLRNRSLMKLLLTAPVVYAIKMAWCIGAARGLRGMARDAVER